MKPTILIILIYFFSDHASCQNRLELDAGIGRATFSPSLINQPGYDHYSTSDNKFTTGISYLRKVGGHVYLGAKIYWEQYSFVYEKDNISSDDAGSDHVDHKSSYLFFAPTIDVGIGRRQRCHTYVSTALGNMVSGYQKTNVAYYGIGGPHFDSTYTSSSSITHLIFRLNFGLVQHIRLDKLWHITISEGFSFMFSNLTVVDNVADLATIHPGYLSLQVGLMRKLKPKTIDKDKTVEKEK